MAVEIIKHSDILVDALSNADQNEVIIYQGWRISTMTAHKQKPVKRAAHTIAERTTYHERLQNMLFSQMQRELIAYATNFCI